MHDDWTEEIYSQLLKCPVNHSSSDLHEHQPQMIVSDIINPRNILVNISLGVVALELWVVEGRPRLGYHIDRV